MLASDIGYKIFKLYVTHHTEYMQSMCNKDNASAIHANRR